MAPGPPNLPSMNKRVENVIRDERGNVILVIGASEFVVFHADGSATKHRVNENIQLVCGLVYNAAMSMGQGPVALLGICEECRRPRPTLFGARSSHGLCSRKAGHNCHRCGRFLCPRHAHHGRDGKWRCRSCTRWNALRRAGHRIFYRCEDE